MSGRCSKCHFHIMNTYGHRVGTESIQKSPCSSVRTSDVGSGKWFKSPCAHTYTLDGARDLCVLPDYGFDYYSPTIIVPWTVSSLDICKCEKWCCHLRPKCFWWNVCFIVEVNTQKRSNRSLWKMFPESHIPHCNTVQQLIDKFRETGSFAGTLRSGGPRV
jgi:hypothetical protein